ncbi:hypothetical protein N7M99_19440 [Shouchella clausii]|uniref:Uncharacterized protein n=2 Tax=Shouchella clausii TaxID=79880 RepID=A0A268NTF0_SHOCL|nr:MULTISPECIES: hypothetical protein [Shouchella]MBU3229483.1 hypothetical protein [Shouchella clausii]MBU3265294.1 hypothetical protein [Shouchella clausii]MBU3506384.1 hypothetical protein [Shouchella clausii]MBU3534739.1 hypothetical protein [Shouchella clausii]MBX0307434.1 hypothetical protein [Shouchella clausii]
MRQTTTYASVCLQSEAFLLMPLYMMAVSSLLYFVASLTFIRAEGVMTIAILTIGFFWIYVPISNGFHFNTLYYQDKSLSIKAKVKKNSRAIAEYSIIAASFSVVAFLYHFTQ